MAFAISRTKKHKAKGGSCTRADKHDRRMSQTLNADPDRTPQNRLVLGSDDITLVEAIKARLDEGAKEAGVKKLVKRKDNVICVEVLLTASPEYFRPENPTAAGTWDPARLAAWEAKAVSYLKDEWGEKNVVRARLHLDEATPHIMAFVVPVVTDDNDQAVKLHAGHWLDGPAKMKGFQTRLGEAFAPLGLERGVGGSKRHHQSIQKFYAEQPRREAEVKLQAEELAARRGVLENEGDAIVQGARYEADALLVEAREAREKAEREKAEAQAKLAEAIKTKAEVDKILGNINAERRQKVFKYINDTMTIPHMLKELESAKKPLNNLRKGPHPEYVGEFIWLDTRPQKDRSERPCAKAVDILLAAQPDENAGKWAWDRWRREMEEAEAAGHWSQKNGVIDPNFGATYKRNTPTHGR